MNLLAPRILLGVVVLATLTAALLVATDGRYQRRHEAEEFQQLVGGLGIGPATDLSQCPLAFDPRLATACTGQQWPIVGGGFFCPQHACLIFWYPALPDDGAPRADPGRHHDAAWETLKSTPAPA